MARLAANRTFPSKCLPVFPIYCLGVLFAWAGLSRRYHDLRAVLGNRPANAAGRSSYNGDLAGQIEKR
jgi:hypothetical protein